MESRISNRLNRMQLGWLGDEEKIQKELKIRTVSKINLIYFILLPHNLFLSRQCQIYEVICFFPSRFH